MKVNWQSASAAAVAIAASLVLATPGRAIDRAILQLLTDTVRYPVSPQLLQPATVSPGSSLVTSYTISQTDLTIPSLWWIQEQFGGNLLENWVAYPNQRGIARRIDLLVDQQNWRQAGYANRYGFVNRFGTEARAFGFNLRVFNQQEELLGAYICQPSENSEFPSCNIFLDSIAPGALQGSGSPFDTLLPPVP